MTQPPDQTKRENFTQCPNVLFHGYEGLSVYDRFVALTLMSVCRGEGPHKLSLREISGLTNVPASLLCTTADGAKKPKEGILDRLERYEIIRVVKGSPINPLSGKKGRQQTYVYIEFAKIWRANTSFYESNKSITPNTFQVRDDSFEEDASTVRLTNSEDRLTNHDVSVTNSEDRLTNHTVRSSRSNVTPNISNTNNTLNTKEYVSSKNDTHTLPSSLDEKREEKQKETASTSPQANEQAAVHVDTPSPIAEKKPQPQPLIERPEKPVMPPSSMKWCEEKMVQIVEAKNGKYYSDTQRPKQLGAAKKILKEKVTEGLFVQAYDKRNDDWWHEHKGRLHVTDLAVIPQGRMMRILEIIDKLEASAAKPGLKDQRTQAGIKTGTHVGSSMPPQKPEATKAELDEIEAMMVKMGIKKPA